MRRIAPACLIVGFLLVPSAARAQASITGTVRDSSGGVLPGVTVEASSPDLIEKVRTAVTDASGLYRIVDLRGGTYTVTFSLTGFATFKREGIQLSGTFVASINAELKVGSLAETITVSGETPIVDVQSVRRQQVIGSELLGAIPAARSYGGLLTLMPGTGTFTGAASDTQVVPQMVVFGGAGGRTNEGRLQLDGLSVGSAFNGAGVSGYVADIANAQEVTLTASGGLGEAEVGGPSLNIVPKEGGNSIKGSFYGSGVTERMVATNYTDALKARGLTTPGELQKVWDFNLGLGGPVSRDRLWYFLNLREEGNHRTVPGMVANANAGDPTRWTYVADNTRPAVLAASYRNTALRLTGQATPRHKFSIFWDEQRPCEGGAAQDAPDDISACRRSSAHEVFAGSTSAPTPSASAILAPETAAYRDFGQRVQQAKWTAPYNRFFLESSFGTYSSWWGGRPIPGNDTQDLIRVVEQCARGCAANGNIAGLTYRSGNWGVNHQLSFNWRASASYVAGAHNVKIGYQGSLLRDDRIAYTNSQSLQYRTNNGLPDQLTESVDELPTTQRVRSDAFYAQDQWTLGRMTLSGAVRHDHAWGYFPATQVGGVRFLPSVISFDRADGARYQDVTPRAGVAIDVFGNGRTSVKINAGKYLEAAQNGSNLTANRPAGRLSTAAVTRTWTDANADWVADCDLTNPLAQGPSTAVQGRGGQDFCGQISDLRFGTQLFNTTVDPDLLSGWGVRAADWQLGAAVQQQVLPRVSVEIGYLRRWLLNFTVTDNLSQTLSDFGVFTVTAPLDDRLPGSGGYSLGPLYNANQNVASVVNNLVASANKYGEWSQVSNSVNLNVIARPRNGLTLQGGMNAGRTSTDRCDVRAMAPEMVFPAPPLPPTISPTLPWCDYSIEFLRFTALGAYTVPKIDIQIAGAMRSDNGADLAANWAAPNSATAGLNRAFSNNAPTVTVNLIEPGTVYGDRVNQLDLRVAKILRFGHTRTNVGIDLYNITNANPVLTYNETFNVNPGSTWLRPNSVLQPRFVKFSAQIDF